MKDKIFDSLQRMGKTFMLPIALLPVAGLLLGIGASFTGNAFLNLYGLQDVMGEGTFIFKFLTVLKDCGDIVFANLPLLFAVGVALGMAKAVKEVAALSAVVAYFMMYAALTSTIQNFMDVEALSATQGLITANYLGFTNTMNTGVFGGIIIGLVVAALHNRYYKIELPASLSFFAGTRFIPIVSALAGVALGILLAFIWPFAARAIAWMGSGVASLGYFGTFIYGYIYRALIPLGLHHVFYLPFWQTALGGTAEVNGQLIEGAQNIVFAQLGAGIPVDPEAAKFFSGMFPFMIFGFPAAALAMYQTAKKERKEDVKGLLLSSSLTSILTGITEPIEFSFLFASPFLYFGVHCVLGALSFVLMHFLNVGVGLTFSGGLLDLILYGVLPGQAMTNWIPVVIVGIVYGFIYYFAFRFFILKFNLKTPGREEEGVETRLRSKSEYQAEKGIAPGTKSAQGSTDSRSALIVEALGGPENLVEVDNCATRLRLRVKDSGVVDQTALKQTGAAGIMARGENVQVIYGTMVPGIRVGIDEYLSSLPDTREQAPADTPVEAVTDEVELVDATADLPETKAASDVVLLSPLTGTAVPLSEVEDQVFSAEMMGKGFAVEPSLGEVVSPINGKVTMVFETKHAIGLTSDEGVEVLIHIGLDTVNLKGEGFTAHVATGDTVKIGDQLMEFDMDVIQAAGYKATTPVIITNTADYNAVNLLKEGPVSQGDEVVEVKA